MIIHSYSSEGIILGRKNFGEADRIISIYSKHFGRLSLLAKGVRRPTSRKRGHIEIFSRINFQATSGKGMDIMTEVDVVDDFPQIRASLKKVSLAYYFCEVIGKITHEGEENIELYNLILENFERLKNAKLLKKLRLNFLTDVLVLLGFWPGDKILQNPDTELERVIEKNVYSVRVGKKVTEEI